MKRNFSAPEHLGQATTAAGLSAAIPPGSYSMLLFLASAAGALAKQISVVGRGRLPGVIHPAELLSCHRDTSDQLFGVGNEGLAFGVEIPDVVYSGDDQASLSIPALGGSGLTLDVFALEVLNEAGIAWGEARQVTSGPGGSDRCLRAVLTADSAAESPACVYSLGGRRYPVVAGALRALVQTLRLREGGTTLSSYVLCDSEEPVPFSLDNVPSGWRLTVYEASEREGTLLGPMLPIKTRPVFRQSAILQRFGLGKAAAVRAGKLGGVVRRSGGLESL